MPKKKIKNKILIFGAKGMLGRELVKAYSDYKLIKLDAKDCDIANEQQVFDTVTQACPNLVINAAAYNSVDEAEADSVIANAVNGFGPKYISQVCSKLDIPFVHYSTDYVFDGYKGCGYDEDDQPNPQSAYGKSKLLGEIFTQHHHQRHYIIRTSRLFGKKGIGGSTKKSFVDVMRGLGKKKKELSVVHDEYGAPTYVKDLAKKTRELVDSKMPYGIYHLTNEGVCSWYDLAREIFKTEKTKVVLHPVFSSDFQRPAPRPPYSYLNNKKFTPLRPWQKALKEYLKN